MGYSCLLTPSVPLFMAGEEFNSDYMPLPRHTRDLYAERDKPGTGTWLYANMIQWDQLSQPAKKAMLEDVKRMLRIRRQESDIFYARTSHDRDFIRETALLCADSIPVPYLLFNQAKAIVVAGNNLPKTVRATLTISLENTPLEGCERYKITDLWNPGKTRIVKPEALQAFQIQLPADKTPGGGLGIWKIEPY